jgi:hypothetical protein
MKSRTDLVHRALKNLGVLPAGMTPSVQEFNAVNDLVDAMIEDLIARDVYYVEDVDAIDEKAFIALGHVLTGIALPEFGLQNDAALTARAQRGEEDLRQMDRNAVRYVHERTMRTDYPTRRGC